MKAMMTGYDAVKARLVAIAEKLAAAPRPAWALDIKAVRILPPVMPQTILNAAVNYTEHAQEMVGRAGITAGPPEKAPPARRTPPKARRAPGTRQPRRR
jgi:2-keto-4-pentenoate hydratase/2-oxohepta-3-ene-1,7-dioic acid hydratase in catechol pathway